MVWFLVALMLASLIYAIFIVGDYRGELEAIQPEIAILEKKAEKLEQAVRGELASRNEVQGRVEEANQLLADLKNQSLNLKNDIQSAKNREQQLEMDKYKSDFRRSKRL